MLVLKNFHVLGLGLEKKVLALALKNFHVLGLGLEKKSWPWPRKLSP